MNIFGGMCINHVVKTTMSFAPSPNHQQEFIGGMFKPFPGSHGFFQLCSLDAPDPMVNSGVPLGSLTDKIGLMKLPMVRIRLNPLLELQFSLELVFSVKS